MQTGVLVSRLLGRAKIGQQLLPMPRGGGAIGVFGRFDLAALVQPHLKFFFVCLLSILQHQHVGRLQKQH